MTPDSKRFLHPEAIRRISRLELRARHIVEGLQTGMHRSPYFGQSVEFLQHRQYVPGDDLRHVDWKVWAKQDRLYVKQFEEETNMRCTMLVDVSASMQYGKGPLNKYEYAATAATSLAYLLLKQHDSVACIAFDDHIRARSPLNSSQKHLHSIVRTLDANKPDQKTDAGAVLREIAESSPRRGMMVVVSDLLGDVQSTLRGLRLLRQRGHDVLVLHIMDDDELDFPFDGPTRFEGLELPDHLNCNPRALRDGYLAALDRFLSDLRHGCAKHEIDYALIRTSDPLDAALAAFLCYRTAAERMR
ncbi:DUF58 domain-containing protein [Bythopirellula polymerisocia]|uniref:VWFA domain-containing protein n=1 Tax=Bythopirellula polymerisocia TaxID=2528003 RepID=A0A5C6CW82_9BACT|nr:DUF58 domain-containing protein [Bythopirellula polymerisocia]TWU27246.1 hypothetical protein Pla144_20170 [Bythopirellula polymerisocia]